MSERTIERQILYARGRLSLAKMYLYDLENGINCPKAVWVGFVEKICAECSPLLPDESATIMARVAPFQAQPKPAPTEKPVEAPANVFRGQAIEA